MSALLLSAAGAPAAAKGAEPVPDQAAWMFDPDAVVEVDLGGLSEEEIEALEADPDEYQPGTFQLRVGGIPQGPLLGEVGIRLKGTASFRPLFKKAGFKVKFDEYVDDQTFFGLEKLTLNNMVQDPSMIHETLTYELFHALGLPASRTGYAFVRVNGSVYGLYLNIETLDEISLPRWFDSTGHLYEADLPEVDVSLGGAGKFEVEEGDDEDLSDLEALIAAVNGEAGDWSDGVATVADLEQMTWQWAVERYVGHWDGYAGQAGMLRPNNYYLHSDAAGLFRMLPWGTDQTWSEHLDFGAPAGGLLFDRCLDDLSCLALYVDALEEVHETVGDFELAEHAAELLELLAPYRALEVPPKLEHTTAVVAASIRATCEFIAERPAELVEWLKAVGRNPPELPVEVSCAHPVSRPPPVPTPTAPTALAPPPPALVVGRTRVLGSRVVTPLSLPGPGRVEQIVAARLGKRRRTVCAAREDRGRAEFVELSCQFSAAARRELKRAPLPLIVVVSFLPPGGDRDLRTRRVVAARQPA